MSYTKITTSRNIWPPISKSQCHSGDFIDRYYPTERAIFYTLLDTIYLFRDKTNHYSILIFLPVVLKYLNETLGFKSLQFPLSQIILPLSYQTSSSSLTPLSVLRS